MTFLKTVINRVHKTKFLQYASLHKLATTRIHKITVDDVDWSIPDNDDELPRVRPSIILDARSPAEFAEDHLPGAINVPVLSDEERAHIGHMYTQESRFEARKLGASMVCGNISSHLGSGGVLTKEVRSGWRPLVYCWRGGQRSHALATVLSEVGGCPEVLLLQGGYRAFREKVRNDLGLLAERFEFLILAGLTGSGKSLVLEELEAAGECVIHLERLARHRGSLLGAYQGEEQPSQKAFESELWRQMIGHVSLAGGRKRPVWLECESRAVGNRHVPPGLWERMVRARRVLLEVPMEARIKHILGEYRHWTEDLESLEETIGWLSLHHPKERISHWLSLAQSGAFSQLVSALLIDHYDPVYTRNRRPYLECTDQDKVVRLALSDLKRESVCGSTVPWLVQFGSDHMRTVDSQVNSDRSGDVIATNQMSPSILV